METNKPHPAALSAEPAAQQAPCDPAKCHSIQENRDYWYGVAEQYRQELYDAKQALAEPAAQGKGWDARGGSLWLDREQCGIVIDALIEHRASAMLAATPAAPAEEGDGKEGVL